jgi:hypothetical protein
LIEFRIWTSAAHNVIEQKTIPLLTLVTSIGNVTSASFMLYQGSMLFDKSVEKQIVPSRMN